MYKYILLFANFSYLNKIVLRKMTQSNSYTYHKLISADNINNKMASENSDRIIFLGERQFVFPSEKLESLKDHGSYFR